VAIRRLWTKQFYLDPADSFVLGNSSLAILGTSALGDRQVEAGNLVLPYNNVVEENLSDTTFIDTDNSTATIDTASENASFTVGQILISKVVAKISAPINSVKWTDLNNNGDAVILEVSNDGGTTFETVTLGTSHTFSSASESDEVIYKITATGTNTITSPIKIQLNQ
jgi:hypothetical protein